VEKKMRTRRKNYVVNLRFNVKSKAEPKRLAERLESLFHFGTLCDSLVDGMDLNYWPRLISAEVRERRVRKHGG
jgi:hypothetical protein